MTDRQTITGFLCIGGILFFLFLFSLLQDGNNRDILLKEGGIIESATTLGYLVCAAFIAYKGRLAYLTQHYNLFLLIIFFMLRELDFDKKFTTMGLFKTKFFLSSTVPLMEKAVGAAIVLLLLKIVLSTLLRYGNAFWYGLRNRSTISFGALITICLLVTSKLLDGLPRKLAKLGIEIKGLLALYAEALEEILEFGIPMIILLTFIAYFTCAKASEN
jgi:hypothetical protein